MSEQIIRYIEQYRGTYTREAINESLLQAGYDPADIEAAWRALPLQPRQFGDDTPAGPPRKWRALDQPAFWLTLLATIVVLWGAASMGPILYVGGQLASWSALALPIAALIAGVALLRRNRAVALGLLYGVLWAVLLPVILLLVVAGICLVMGVNL